MKITVKDREPFELANVFYINPNGWFCKCWLIESPFSNALTHQFVVEADTESDAIDTLLDSKFGHFFLVDNHDMEEYKLEYEKDITNRNKSFDEWLEEEKDCARGGNDGNLYHADCFMHGCINRCAIEEFDYQ